LKIWTYIYYFQILLELYNNLLFRSFNAISLIVQIKWTAKRYIYIYILTEYFMFPLVHFLIKYIHCIVRVLFCICNLPSSNTCQVSLPWDKLLPSHIPTNQVPIIFTLGTCNNSQFYAVLKRSCLEKTKLITIISQGIFKKQ
jgi:hypothetical protein